MAEPFIWICLVAANTEGDSDSDPRIRAWTANAARAAQLVEQGLDMVPVYRDPPAHSSAATGDARSFDTTGTVFRRVGKVLTITCETDEIANRVADQLRTPVEPQSVSMREALRAARPFVERQADYESGLDHGVEDACAANLLKKIDAALAMSRPAAQAAQVSNDTAEEIAKWLHDETGHPDSYPDHTWPETERDDGRREGGWVKIVPQHAQAYFRDIARRMVARFPLNEPQTLSESYRDTVRKVAAACERRFAQLCEVLEKIIEMDQRESFVTIETDPAGNTMAVKMVDGPCAALARNALSLPRPKSK